MKRLIFAALLASMLFALPAQAQQYNQFQIQFVDWEDRPVNLGTSISITFFVGTNTGGSASLAVYKDAAGQLTCTSPITDNSTNTPLLYTTGLMTFFTGARSFKMVVTDGTYTTSYGNINTSQNVRWPPPGVASAGNSLGQNDDLDFSYAGIILDGDTVGQIELIPDSDGGIWKIGDATKQMDLYWYTGDGSNYIFADEGNALLNFVDIDVLFDDDAILYVGSHSDFSVKSSTTKVLDILPLTTDESSTINFGANLQGVDLKLFSATTGTYTLFDASDDSLKFVHDDIKLDDNSLLYVGSDLDFSIKSSTTKNLDILTLTDDESSIVNFGANLLGVDVKLFGATTGLSFLWDASLDKVVVTDLLNLFTTSGAVANQFKVDATGTVAGYAIVLETTNGGVQFNIDGAANGDLEIDADSKIDVNALDDISITVASGSAGEDLLLTQSGANDSHITIQAAGTSADAISLVTTGGGITTTSAGTYTATAVGAVGLFSNAVAQTITLGNATGASSLALKAGTGNISMEGVAATTITIGKSDQTGVMKFGESTGILSVSLGTGGTGAKTIAVGDGASTGSVTLYSGSGDIILKSTDAINIAQDSVAQIVTIGNETGASALNLKAGTGNIDVQGVAATTITIGDAAQTGTISLGTSSAGLTMNLGTGNGAKVVNVATGTGIDQIVLGGGGTAADNIDIADEDTQANTIDIGGTASTTTLTGTVTNTAGYIRSAVNVGAVAGATCTAVEYSNNGFHRTVLTLLTGTTVTVSDGGDGTGINIYNFPQGNIIVLGAFADVVLTADAHMTGAYAASIGTVTAAADNALSSTEADFVASTAITQGSNQDFHGLSALTAAGLVMVPYNGTTTGAPVYFNAAAADGSTDAAAVVTAQSGTVVIEWVYLGDF